MLPTGEVNCSLSIYHDRKTWRRSRNNIDLQIQRLRQKLEDLKEIRKHLKKKRPVPNAFDDFDDEELINFAQPSTTEISPLIFDNFEPSSDSSENISFSSTEQPRFEFKNKTRKHRIHEEKLKEERKDEILEDINRQMFEDRRKDVRPQRRKHKLHNTTDISNITSLIDFGLFEINTTSRPVQFTNHHRHHHRIITPASSTTPSSTTEYEPSTSPSTPEYEEDDRSTTEQYSENPNRINNRVRN